MNYHLLPDLAAMATLLTILYFLRRRHPQERVGLWLVGLLFIFLEAIAHALYAPSGPATSPRTSSHSTPTSPPESSSSGQQRSLSTPAPPPCAISSSTRCHWQQFSPPTD